MVKNIISVHYKKKKKQLSKAEKHCTNKTTHHFSLINSPHSKAQFKSIKVKQGEIGNFHGHTRRIFIARLRVALIERF